MFAFIAALFKITKTRAHMLHQQHASFKLPIKTGDSIKVVVGYPVKHKAQLVVNHKAFKTDFPMPIVASVLFDSRRDTVYINGADFFRSFGEFQNPNSRRQTKLFMLLDGTLVTPNQASLIQQQVLEIMHEAVSRDYVRRRFQDYFDEFALDLTLMRAYHDGIYCRIKHDQ